ncbi:MAG: hypothetical protein L0Z54_00980 [Thermoplasmata archaeon]|nr:hypothetical protein [Thermoplasmata archaeon]
MDEQERHDFRDLLGHYGRKIMAFRRIDGSWNSSEVFRSDVDTTLDNFLALSSVHGFMPDPEYASTLSSALTFLLDALDEGDLDHGDLAELFHGLCIAHAHTGDPAYRRAIERIAPAVVPDAPDGEEVLDISEDHVDPLLPIMLSFGVLPRGYRGRVRALVARRIDLALQRRNDVRTRTDAVRLAILLDQAGAVLGKARLREDAREFVQTTFGRKADDVWIEEVLVARYLQGEDPGDPEATERIRRYLKRRVLHIALAEDVSNITFAADVARTRWAEVLDTDEARKISSRIDSMARDRLLRHVNPDGGWGDEYVYRSTASAGIALYNIYIATGAEVFRDAAHDAGEYLKSTLWDLSEGIYYSLDRISEFLYLLHDDLGDETYSLLLEHFHDRLRRSLDALDPNDRERTLWYSAELCILTYYLVKMTGDRRHARPLVEVAVNLSHLLDPGVYDQTHQPWFQATVLAQEALGAEEGSDFGLFKPYLARMSIDRDTTINEEIDFQRFLYTYGSGPFPGMVRTATRRARRFLGKGIIPGISHVIQLAKVFRLLEENDGGDVPDGAA